MEFLKHNMELIVSGVAVSGIYSLRKYIFLNVLMKYIPNYFISSMSNLGAYVNENIEKKKIKNKKIWSEIESNIILGIKSFNDELRKGSGK